MLPSLNAIKVFEAAARHVNFARAAEQLGVQPPAVSRQIAELEATLGVELFVRSKPRLTLTAKGEELFSAVSIGLNEIRQACERVSQRKEENRLRVETSISFVSCWLLARLPDFHRRYPEIDLQLLTRDTTDTLNPQDTDIAIAFGDGDLPCYRAERIFAETMIAVCSPEYFAGDMLLSPQQMLEERLLMYGDPRHRDDWSQLFGSVGLNAPPIPAGLSYNSYIVYVQAALNGDGIALGWRHLLDDHIDAGRLKVASSLSLSTARGYFCYMAAGAADKPQAAQFMDWVCAQTT